MVMNWTTISRSLTRVSNSNFDCSTSNFCKTWGKAFFVTSFAMISVILYYRDTKTYCNDDIWTEWEGFIQIQWYLICLKVHFDLLRKKKECFCFFYQSHFSHAKKNVSLKMNPVKPRTFITQTSNDEWRPIHFSKSAWQDDQIFKMFE